MRIARPLHPISLHVSFRRSLTTLVLAGTMVLLTLAAAPRSLPGGDVRVNQDAGAQYQTEVSVIANPADPLNVVAAWADDSIPHDGRLLDGPDPGIGVSFDGGRTWQSQVLFYPELCYAPDPSIGADDQGNIYVGFLTIPADCDFAKGGMGVARSTDGGRTFGPRTEVGSFTDKSVLVVDPGSGAVYVLGSGLIDGRLRSPIFSRSLDGGATFSPTIWIAGGKSQGGGPAGAIGPNGEIYATWVKAGNRTSSIYFDRSLDGGTTWLRSDVLVERATHPPNPTASGIRHLLLPFITVDRSAGPFRNRIYIAWSDARFGSADILLSHSSDQGGTWSAPVRVNDDAAGGSAEQFFPWPAVDENGVLFVGFLDTRGDPANLRFAEFLAVSTDGGNTFPRNIQVSDGSSGIGSAPHADYDFTGLDVRGGLVHPIWADGRNDNMDIFTHTLNAADFDEDGVPGDGDGNGQYADHPCIGGATAACDDNCPGTANPLQEDADSDGFGDACDPTP